MKLKSEDPRKFFIIVPIQFEELALSELIDVLNHLSVKTPEVKGEKGGLELDLPLSVGLQLNRFLKIPTRILLRDRSFKCTDFKKFEAKLSTSPWRNYVGSGKISWEISSHKSRLYNKKKLEELANKAYQTYRVGQPIGAKESNHDLKVFIRFYEDQCQVSIDTSGEPLYRRGYKTHITDAPLRENLAAGLLRVLGVHQLADQNVLVDPMMGSGTFLLETFFRSANLKKFRKFSYEGFKINIQELELKTDGMSPKLVGRDLDPKSILAVQENFKGHHDQIDVAVADIFKAEPSTKRGCLIINPPYGERLKLKEDKKKYFYGLMEKIIEVHEPIKFGIIIPESVFKNKTITIKDYKINKALYFKNGGIRVEFWVAVKESS